jgi:hypothetical protein
MADDQDLPHYHELDGGSLSVPLYGYQEVVRINLVGGSRLYMAWSLGLATSTRLLFWLIIYLRYAEPGQRGPALISSIYLYNSTFSVVVLVRKRTIPTERPQPAGEVSANFS